MTETRLLHRAIVPGRPGWTLWRLGGPVRTRVLVTSVVAVLAVVALVVVATTTGTIQVSLDRVLAVVAGTADRADEVVIGKRIPRALAAVEVGFALGVAGAITQSLTRNPIASPDILGVSAGAGAFAVAALVSPIGMLAGSAVVPAAALLGGLATAAIIVLISWRRSLDPMRLVVTGVGISAIAAALTDWLLLRGELEDAAVATRWLVGSLGGAGWQEVTGLAPLAIATLLLAWPLSRELDMLRLGPDVARSLGTRVGAAQVVLALLAVVLVAATTAAVGPIGFVAFVAPQVAMRVFGTAGPPPVAGGLLGALLVLGADMVAAALPVELPAGVITSMVGGPVLLLLLFRSVRSTSA